MKLTRIRIRNFRSLWSDDGYSVDITLSREGNYFAGPNNAGKSNLFRALELALGTNPPGFDKDKDWPESKVWTNSTIHLDFDMGKEAMKKKNVVGTLAKLADAYERAVGTTTTFAEDGKLSYHVQFSVKGARTERIMVRGKGATMKSGKELDEVLGQFHGIVRFVDIRSGESLESMMERGFREILGSVLKERFAPALARAQAKQDEFKAELATGVMQPLAKHIEQRVARYVPGVKAVELVPAVGSVDDAIISARFDLTDTAKTALDQKGTGVRGAVLLTLMSFIAEASRRAVVFAIEEPESFLHPGKHRELGRALEAFTKRDDVTLLVTTHSPFMFSMDAKAAVFSVQKSDAGQTQVRGGSPDQLASKVRHLLMEGTPISGLVDLVTSIPPSDHLLVVEGESDRAYLQIVMEKLGKPLADVSIIACNGADDAALKAILLSDLVGHQRVLVLLDADAPGKSAKAMLVEKLKASKFQSEQVMLYSDALPEDGAPVEAEDLFPEELVREFLKDRDHFMAEVIRVRKRVHIGLTKDGKEPFCEWLPGRISAAKDLARWSTLLEKISARVAKAKKRQDAAANAETAQGAAKVGALSSHVSQGEGMPPTKAAEPPKTPTP